MDIPTNIDRERRAPASSLRRLTISQIPSHQAVKFARGRRWVEEQDRHGMERAVLLSRIMSDESSVARSVHTLPDRLIGFFMVEPTRPNALQRVLPAVEHLGLTGIKGFPAMECFHAYEERVYPVYEEAQQLGVPILFHFGLLQSAIGAALKLASQADARFSNPMDVQRAARDFPRVNFIVPHSRQALKAPAPSSDRSPLRMAAVALFCNFYCDYRK